MNNHSFIQLAGKPGKMVPRCLRQNPYLADFHGVPLNTKRQLAVVPRRRTAPPAERREQLIQATIRCVADHGLARSQVGHWIAHTGGPKVLRAMQEALELPADALARSWKSLAEVGNLSSASVLFVAGDFLDAEGARPGDYGVLLSMGPGFCGELVLLQW